VTERSPTIAGAALADPSDPDALNGVPGNLLPALGRLLPSAGGVDASLTRPQRALVAARSFHPRRERWRERFYKNELGFRLQSANSGRALRALERMPDVVVQFFGLFRTEGAPYVVYTDWTHQLTRSYWPEWSPFRDGAALESWYALERELYHGAAHLFPWSPLTAESLVSFYGVPSERVTVVGVGANFEPVAGGRARDRDPVVLFVGREWRRKGGDVLVRALQLVRETLPGARLRVVGPEAQVAAPGVDYLGPVEDRKRLAALYDEASVFCLPSRAEPYGLVVAEAMAHGVPCVVTEAGGIADTVEHGETGLVVPREDAEALAAALLRLLQDSELAARMGEAARRRVRRVVNWDRVAEDMASVIRTIVQAPPPQP
jgi:glycosyltransferase involved in cell wall biosynthesis